MEKRLGYEMELDGLLETGWEGKGEWSCTRGTEWVRVHTPSRVMQRE